MNDKSINGKRCVCKVHKKLMSIRKYGLCIFTGMRKELRIDDRLLASSTFFVGVRVSAP